MLQNQVEAEGLLALDVSSSGHEAVALIASGPGQEQLDAIVDAVKSALPEVRALIIVEAKDG